MRIGEYNRRITIETRVGGKDSSGDPNDSWVLVVKTWAKKEDLSGREFFAAQADQNEITTRFSIRYREGLQEKMRIVLGAKGYNIEAVLDRDGDRCELQLMCSSGLVDG
jgi:SPP1 family predicted phage head-tail adaptor